MDAGIPLSRYEVDRIFLELLEREEFAPRTVYYFGVRIFGGLFGRFTRWKRHCRGRKVPL